MKKELCAALLLSGAVLVGCDEKKDATPSMDTAAKKTDNAMDKTGDAMKSGMDKTGAAMDKAGDKVVAGTDKAMDGMTTDTMEAQKEATTLMDQVKTYIAEKKWSDADAALVKLDALKSKLPATFAAQIDTLKDSVAKMKAMTGGMPTMPK